MRLAGKVAIVSGAASGIGRAIAEACAREGARLAIADVNREGALAVVEAISKEGGEARAFEADVTRWPDVDALVTATLTQFGHIDILVNNAGISGSPEATILHLTPEVEWDRVMAVNVKGVFLCCKRVLPEMMQQGGGKIINVASAAGIVAFPGRAAYTASKGAVALLTRSLAVDYAPYHINVNALCPGMTYTPMTAWRLDDPELRQQVEAEIPWGRVAQVQDLMGSFLFLASSDSDYMTGHLLVVDGGWLAH